MECFTRLGRELKQRWRAVGLDEEQFPGIARRALEEARLHEQTNIDEIARSVLEADHIVIQPNIDYDFGSPPLTVFSDERFLIEILFWLDGHTGVHQHWFAGAFCVFQGSSIHCEYSFDVRQRINSRLMSGNLTLKHARLLNAGDACEIALGDRFIHSVFHLEVPTVSVVIRTPERNSEGPPPFSYYRSGIARVPFYVSELLKRQTQFLELTYRLSPTDFERRLADCIGRLDCYSVFEILAGLSIRIGNEPLEPAFELAIARHGEIIGLLEEETFASGKERRALHEQRARLEDQELRFALALLQEVPTRNAIIDVIRQRSPDLEPLDAMLGWIERFWRAGVVYDWNDRLFGLLRILVTDQPLEVTSEVADDIETLKASIFRPLLS
jgi:hypothetical protein